VKSWDAIIVGAGIIGLSLAVELNKRGLKLLVVEKGEPGREASWAAGGMLADDGLEVAPALQELASASARMYPEFVHELEDESRMKIDLRDTGAIVLIEQEKVEQQKPDCNDDATGKNSGNLHRLPQPLRELEPAIDVSGRRPELTPLFLQERSVDPRHLTAAAIAAAKHRGIDFSSGDEVLAIETADGKATGVRTSKTQFASGLVINCAGAWAGKIGEPRSGPRSGPQSGPRSGPRLGDAANPAHVEPIIPTRPVKGQMLSVAMPRKEMVRHVIRTPNVYLIPRSDGRLVIGATQEEAGFDKKTVPETIQRLHQAALEVAPKLEDARILEAWAGLRPGTPDALPIMGGTSTRGYFVATGHFRDGILLSPATARVMGQVVAGEKPDFDLTAFAVERFESRITASTPL